MTLYALDPVPDWIDWSMSAILKWPLKLMHQFWTLFYTLMYATPPAQWIIIQVSPALLCRGRESVETDHKQNPPSIPTFHVALLVALFRSSKVVIDWHNYGHTLLSTGYLSRPAIPLYRFYETLLGRWVGDAHLAVTDAMARQLRQKPFLITKPIYTLHDRPAELFRPVQSVEARKKFLSVLPETKDDAQNIIDGAVRLVVSSTSWTRDEDFGMLLDALVAYASPDSAAVSAHDPPSPILAIITGRGPDRDVYVKKIKELQNQSRLPGIRILTAWLSNRGYAELLACADLGISLHKSSSGVDLPMKVVDMFGAGLPVAAYSAFESIGELVKEGVNGCGFEDAEQLTEVLRRLLGMAGEDELAKLKEGAVQEGALRWDEEWNRVVAPVIGLEDKQ